MAQQLSKAEKRRLTEHETTIERGQKTFIDVGRALLAIREEQLYVEEYDTWDAYITKKWGFSKRWANQQIESMKAAGDIADLEFEMPEVGTVVPAPKLNERQARELAKVETEQDRANVVAKALETAKIVDGKPKITAAALKKAAESNGKPPKKKKAVKDPDVTGPQWCNHQAKQLMQIAQDLDKWKKKHAKGDSRWVTILQNMDAAHKAFRGLGRVK